MSQRFIFAAPALAFLSLLATARAQDDAALALRYDQGIRPVVTTYCLECHDKDDPEADFDLSAYQTMPSVLADFARWEKVLDRLKSREMPTKKAEHPLPDDLRQQVVDWLQTVRKNEAIRNADDPGLVLARRLSNAEYDYTIRDLTGFDLRPTREFPVDPANQAGFDNSGESLMMSPTLVKKYLQAARGVAEHLVLKPDGLGFASHPVLVETDRDRYSTTRIVDFYRRQPTDLVDYFLAAWRFECRSLAGKSSVTLAEVAEETKVSPKYLAIIWSTLTDENEKVGPIAKLQKMWHELPQGEAKDPASARIQCERMRDFIIQLRAKLVPVVENMSSPGLSTSCQPYVLWKDRQLAANRRRFDPSLLQVTGAALAKDANGVAPQPDPELVIPRNIFQRGRYEKSFARFCSVFPDAFYIAERGRVFMAAGKDKYDVGRLLSAGFHSMTGYFRDDGPLYELILNESQQRELDGLWREFDVVASVPMRMHSSMLWDDRADSDYMLAPEFDSFRAEDPVTPEAVARLAKVYVAKSRKLGANAQALAVLQDHFNRVEANVRAVLTARIAAEPSQLAALENFAERAYRRPLTAPEREALRNFYRARRDQDGLDYEEAMRDCVVSVLMSPHFCYRIDLLEAAGSAPKSGSPIFTSIGAPVKQRPTAPLSDYALASRLSYFLWSSMPDRELLDHAAAGDLHRPEVMVAEARRMMKDERIRDLATEFGGNWLDFRRFEEINSVDRERFPTFDNELRESMFQEPIRFMVDLIVQDRSVMNCLYGDYTFVNAPLARHYGMPPLSRGPDDWVRMENAGDFGRGGLLPMAVFLTANSPGLRTSPVKRGYWVVRRLLGEKIPPPPAQVPALPNDEANVSELSVRDALARHRQDQSCAACHARFDSFGLVFEGFGAVGERREKDFGGRPVDTKADFPGGFEGAGLDGLRRYVRGHREADFTKNLASKLLAYALGRTLAISDEDLVHQMQANLVGNGYRFSSLVESIVTSPQFLRKRIPVEAAGKASYTQNE